MILISSRNNDIWSLAVGGKLHEIEMSRAIKTIYQYSGKYLQQKSADSYRQQSIPRIIQIIKYIDQPYKYIAYTQYSRSLKYTVIPFCYRLVWVNRITFSRSQFIIRTV